MRGDTMGKSDGQDGNVLSLCLREKLWIYRGEGNANLVIALPDEGVILRLHKWERGKEITPQIQKDEEHRIHREVLFCKSIMVPLLGSAYIQPPIPTRLDDDDLVQLDATLNPQRPAYRIHKGVNFGHATIYPDYALLPLLPCKCSTEVLSTNSDHNEDKDVENTESSVENSTTAWSRSDRPQFRFDDNSRNRCLSYDGTDRMHRHISYGGSNVSGFGSEDDIFLGEGKNFNSLQYQSIHRNRRTGRQYSDPLGHLSPLCVTIRSRYPHLHMRFSVDNNKPLSPDYLSSCSTQRPSHLGLHRYPISSSAPDSSFSNFEMWNKKSPVFCVEIKPKQGWIPLMDRTNPKCTFCLNQYLKLSKGSVAMISRYCPLDLFSGNENRMKNALKELLSTPQNNLKLFRDGVLMYSDDVNGDLLPILKEWFEPSSRLITDDDDDDLLHRLIDKFCGVVFHALTTDLTADEPLPEIEDTPGPVASGSGNRLMLREVLLPSDPVINTSSSSLMSLSRYCDWTSHQLPSNCILDRILKIQQLQRSGADAVYNMFRNVCPEESDYNYVNKLCNHPPGKLLLDPLQRYLLATTAKDCSILIAFQRINRDQSDSCRHHLMKDSDGINYAWNIGVSDLDPKPVSCIDKHRKRDMDGISALLEYFKNI